MYKFDLVLDSYVDIEIANTNTAIISIYAEDFMGYDGPSTHNKMASSINGSLNIGLFSGSYYLIVSSLSENSTINFNIDIESTQSTVPQNVTNIYPPDNSESLKHISTVLSWDFSELTYEYRLLFGTSYPFQQ